MRFDDRLKTAIMQPVVDSHDRVVRWRQVIDLLSRLPEEFDEAIADAGFALVEREALAVPEGVRAATARNVASRPATYRMVALFSRDRLAVAAPVLASANLSANEWAAIARDCSPEVASFIQALVRGSELPRETVSRAEPAAVPSPSLPDPLPTDEPPSISQMVARIEQLRSRRASEELADAVDSAIRPPVEDREVHPARPSARTRVGEKARPGGTDSGALFRWESDPTGQIAWVDGVPRGAFVGSSMAAFAPDETVRRAVDAREPFQAVTTHFDAPAAQGEWQLSGVPTFSPRDGRFLGYRGIARRSEAPRIQARPSHRERDEEARPRPRDVDALRETIHEIKTPLNAIIGFAEIIDGQYLGPAHRNYRQRAAGIVAQARTLLEAIQDMEYAARLQSDVDGEPSVNLDELMESLGAEWQQRAQRRDVGFSIFGPDRELRCGFNPELGRRLIKRFIDAAIDAAEPGERIMVEAAHDERDCLIGVTRPKSTTGVSEATLLDTAYGSGEGGEAVLGLGFALRLVRGLARFADGDVEIGAERLLLRFPRT